VIPNYRKVKVDEEELTGHSKSMYKAKFPLRNDSFLTGKNIIPTGNMFLPMEIMLQPREMDNCLREIYHFQRELDNFCGNWIIASGNFPFAVEKMIFPVGDELFLTGNYPFPISEDPSLAGNTCLLPEIIHCR
jgi:hypothetical protein